MATIENYSSNSHKSKEASLIRPVSSLDIEHNQTGKTTGDKKKNEKIIQSKVERRKQKTSKKILNALIGDDIPDVKEHIIWDVMIPSIRDTIRNSLINVIESIFGGGASNNHQNGSYISYSSISNPSVSNRTNRSGRSLYDYDEIIFSNRGEADAVLQQLIYSIKRYGYVSILDYYDMVGVRTRPSDANYGWINLNNASVERVSGGYLLRLPQAMPID